MRIALRRGAGGIVLVADAAVVGGGTDVRVVFFLRGLRRLRVGRGGASHASNRRSATSAASSVPSAIVSKRSATVNTRSAMASARSAPRDRTAAARRIN